MKTLFKHIVASLLSLEARLLLSRHHPIIIGVTGSVGKTSTKEAIATALSVHYEVRKSAKSFNSELGVPLTILGEDTGWMNPFAWAGVLARGLFKALAIRRYPEVLVLELGVDAPHDMERLMQWLPLDVAVVGYIGDTPVHSGNFPSVDALREEKLKIFHGLRKGGKVVLAHDDEKVRVMRETFGPKASTFGFGEGATVRGDRYAITYDAFGTAKGIEANILIGSSMYPFSCDGVLGKQFVYPALAAVAVARALDNDPEEAVRALQETELSPGRMRLLKGLKDSTIIDDTYNASPVALREALATLHDIRVRGKKIAVLGDMRELGALSKEAHRSAGAYTATFVDSLVTVGDEAEEIANSATDNGLMRVKAFKRAEDAIGYVHDEIASGDVVLCKGSQGVRIEKIVSEILKEPRDAKLLVRQGSEWNKR